MSGTNGEHDITKGGMHDERDAHMDANLRAVGAAVGRVPSPSAEQLRAWRENAPSVPALRITESTSTAQPTPARPTRSRWLAIGSGIAACIAGAAVIFFQPWGSTVQASTIIQKLRTRQFGGLNIRFDHVSSQGMTINGEARMRLKRPVSIDTMDSDRPLADRSNFGAAYGSFTLTSDSSAPSWAGVNIKAEGSLTPGNGWLYVSASDEAVQRIVAADPRAALPATLAAKGVLLDFGAIDDELLEGLHAAICPVEACVKGGSAGEIVGSIDKLPDGRKGVSIDLRAHAGNKHTVEQAQRLAGLARLMLSGKARQGEMDQVRRMLQEDFSQRASVQKMGSGRYRLAAELNDPEDPSTDGKPDATLTVMYEESGGVLWAELSSIRDTTGTIRIEFAAPSDPIDPALLKYDRLVEQGKTNYIDVGMLARMFLPKASK